MYVGLIIVFNTFDSEVLKEYFITSINAMADVKICLVCNSSNEQVFEVLTEIAEHCNNTNVVNTKRKKLNTASVRAGARYMNNQFNLKYLGFIVGLDNFEILEVLKTYVQHQETIIALNKIEKGNKAVKPTFYQSLFSVTEYLKKIASSPII
ncbi:hypothetical protein [Winogradskyella sp.]|uniref:hypothetical protein n=1 Tax=Winogradskyella sp. TaxID=1883156 RepID=UPI0026186C2D|nr:hypothetical protein [Winogradskyella sp.]